MFEKMNNGGAVPNGRGQEMASKAGNGYMPPAGRPPPINTAIARGVQALPQSTTTSSSTVYSASEKTGSSVQYTPAFSIYTPTIWSSGVGTPMSASEIPNSASMKSTLSQETPKASQKVPVHTNVIEQAPVSVTVTQHAGSGPPRGSGGHLSSMQLRGTKANDAPVHPASKKARSSAAPPVHFERNSVAEPYRVTYFDRDGVPRQNAFPLRRLSDGELVDADGQPCRIPKKAEVLSEDGKRMTGRIKSDAAVAPAALPAANLKRKAKTFDQNTSETVHIERGNKYETETSSQDSDGTSQATYYTQEDYSMVISPHYTQTRPELANRRAPTWREEVNGDNLKAQLQDFRPLFQEAIPNGIKTTLDLGSEFFKMSWGSRAVCIKLDDVRNVHWAIQHGACVVMDKVGQRITELLDECKNPDEHVWLLFSVNKQKSYCGLARLGGRWSKSNDIRGWVGADRSKIWGVIPVEWRYVKNISYDYFQDIMNTRSGQPITNMWNGMHFPYDEGRKVLEIFVQKAAFTNVMCWRGDRVYNPFMEITHAAQLDPRLRTRPNDMTLYRMAHGIKKAPSRPSTAKSSNLTVEDALPQTPTDQKNARKTAVPGTPVTQLRRGVMAQNTADVPSNFDGPASPSPRPGQVVQCIVDENGNYIPVTPTNRGGTATTMPQGPSGFTPKQQAPIANMRGYAGRGRAQFRAHGGHVGSPISAGGVGTRHTGFIQGMQGPSLTTTTAPKQPHSPAVFESPATKILRQAVSKDNLFVPKNLTSPNKDALALPVDKTPLHFFRTEHTSVSKRFHSVPEGFHMDPMYPTPTDQQISAASSDRDSCEYDKMAAEIDELRNTLEDENDGDEGDDGEAEGFYGGVSLK